MTEHGRTGEAPQSVTRRTFLGAVGVAALSVAHARSGALAFEMPVVATTRPEGWLSDQWMLQSSEVIKNGGDELSRPDSGDGTWYPVTVPSTVLAALVANGEYSDLYFSDNLKKVPVDRFRVPWWYRQQFTLRPGAAGKQLWLHFKGINYRANIWLNGKLIVDSKVAVGAYRDLELNVTPHVAPGQANALAVEVFPPRKNEDLAITFVDWAPGPPDHNMGIWQDVELRTSGPVALRCAHIVTDLEVPSLSSAKLTVMADLVNATDQPVTAMVEGQIEGLRFKQEVSLAARETKTVALEPVTIDRPRLWWPSQLGKPEMYDLQLRVNVNGAVSDQSTTRFGIRKVTSRLDNGHLLFTVNGVDLLILGSGYCPDLLQRRTMSDRPTWQEDHVRYVRDMNLNTIRLEGKLEDDSFFDICDRYGILVMAGWCCCSPWEQWNKWKDEQHAVAEASLRYQLRKMRTHPSLLCWMNGSDNHPPKDVEEKYLAIAAELKWPCPTVSSATAKKSPVSGASGVKMEGPYKWVPPVYWYTDRKKGGAWGFNTEVGPGAVPPPLESLEKMLPADHRWPIDDVWNFHCGSGKTFSNMTDFTEALDARFGKSKGIADFSWKAQAQAYETFRALYEAFRRNKFTEATGQIQWMQNNAWPSMIWHLYDYYWRPGGAYFATKLACEPVHALYSYHDRAIVIVNDTLEAFEKLRVTAEVYDIDAKQVHRQAATKPVPANDKIVVFTLPALPAEISTTYFIRLVLEDAWQHAIGVNTYFLSTRADELSTKGGEDDWNITRCTAYADFTALEKLPRASFSLNTSQTWRDGEHDAIRVAVTNTSSTIAVMTRLKLTRGPGGEEVLPVLWQDNYFTLLPGETREAAVRWLPADLQGAAIAVAVDCFNNGRT